MSNGTRIDPEEREPRAIKIRHRKRNGKKIAFIILSAMLVIAVCGTIICALCGKNWNQYKRKIGADT